MGLSKIKITLVYPYYDNPKMFVHQQECWNNWPPHLFPFFEVIVTDDCSPRWPAVDNLIPDRRFNFSLYRIDVNVRWNWIAAKNLGANFAEGQWLFLTDMDHRLDDRNFSFLLKQCIRGQMKSQIYYTFNRVDAPRLTPYKNHPNTYFMAKKLFWEVGGYDEEFSGYYGTDGYYRKRINQLAKHEHLEKAFVIRYPREVISDASTTEFLRKRPHDKLKKNTMWRKLKKNKPMKALTFPWTKLI